MNLSSVEINFLNVEKYLPILNYYYIEKIINDHLDNLEDNGRKIWSLINYVIWYKIFISKKIIIKSIYFCKGIFMTRKYTS